MENDSNAKTQTNYEFSNCLHNENDNSFTHQLRVELVDGPPKEPRMSNMAGCIVKLLYEGGLQFVSFLGIQRKGIKNNENTNRKKECQYRQMNS
jgi:hypothetical protein